VELRAEIHDEQELTPVPQCHATADGIAESGCMTSLTRTRLSSLPCCWLRSIHVNAVTSRQQAYFMGISWERARWRAAGRLWYELQIGFHKDDRCRERKW
jgi:hypothetical protein